MRKLVYVGTKGNANIEVTDFMKKQELEKQGFRFTERLDEVTETETEEQREKRLARVAKRIEAIKRKREKKA